MTVVTKTSGHRPCPPSADDDHYDLEDVKDRTEFLAVQKLKSGAVGPILCFVGPLGVAKPACKA